MPWMSAIVRNRALTLGQALGQDPVPSAFIS